MARSFPPSENRQKRLLLAKYQLDTGQHRLKLAPRNTANLLCEQIAINGHNLGDIGNRSLGQTSTAGREENVAWRIGPSQVACQRHTDNSSKTTPIERVTLND